MLCCSIALATACLAQVREWTNREGKTVRAEFVEVAGEMVKLKSAKTGKVYSLAVESLSEEDRAYIRDLSSANDGDREALDDLEKLTGIKFSPIALIILAVLNLPLCFFWGKFLFNDWAGFLEALKFWLTPDSWSFLKGEAMDDWFAEMKLFVWVAGSIAAVLGEYYLLQKYLL